MASVELQGSVERKMDKTIQRLNEADIYAVEGIVDVRKQKNTIKYLVKWEGYDWDHVTGYLSLLCPRSRQKRLQS